MVKVIIHKVKCGKCDKQIFRSDHNRVTYCERCNQKKKNKDTKSLRGGQKWAPCGHGKLGYAHNFYGKRFYQCKVCDKKYTKNSLEMFWGKKVSKEVRENEKE